MDCPFQVNYSARFDGNNKIIEKSLLINIRGEQLPIVIANFVNLRSRLNGELAGIELPKLPNAKPQIRVIKQSAQEQTSYPYPGNCERCGAAMVLRTAKRGPRVGQKFWSCCAYSRGCLSTKAA